MTPSEKYVAELCEKSFLPFWSFPNPIGKKGKELCDVLVVCGNTIIIISVKDISISNSKDEMVAYDRWVKKSIYDSATQIYGAEKYLNSVDCILLKDRKTKIDLPFQQERVIHRIAIAFGGRKDYPMPTGDLGKGFVHVFDKDSTFTVLNELDTIIDFSNYLGAKEKFISKKVIITSTESDFLSFYLQTGLDFESCPDVISIEQGSWKKYVETDEYAKWQEDIAPSYIWDFMIDQLYENHVKNKEINSRKDIERAIRLVNTEPRMHRIVLGEMLEEAINKKIKARMLLPLEGAKHTYVFMPLTDKNWKEKEKELEYRCVVARKEIPTVETVIGVAIGSNSKDESCFDIFVIHMNKLDDKFIEAADFIKEELGYFSNPTISRSKKE